MSALAALLACAEARAGQATGSDPGLPVGAATSSDLVPRQLTLTLTTSFLPASSEQILIEPQGTVGYDANLTFIETRLAGEYSLRPWLALGFAVPYRVADIDVTYRDRSGEAVAPSSLIHARDEILRGFGDPSLHVHLTRAIDTVRLHARLGTSVPLGGTVEDPFALGATDQDHQHIQFGTGTFIPFVVLEAQRTISHFTLAGWLLARASLTENHHGFRAGDRYAGGITGSGLVGSRAVTLSAGAELHVATADEWHGVVYEDEGNAGRRDLLAGVAAIWRPRSGLALVADVKVPIYSEVVGPQLDYSVVGGLSVVGTFDFRRRPSWRGLDQAALEPAGTAAPLVAVPGRITVFDFWAVWCPPCREFDGELARLVRGYPGRVSVRKLDVVDTDSAAWARYLEPGGYGIPHIKVVGEDGTILFEMSAAPGEMIRALEAVLRAPAGK
jgi:thiol-disulfide isomerase/thioredoxin